MIVACVKHGTKYGAEYVNHLADQVRAHTTMAHAFVCMTEDPAGLDKGIGVWAMEPGASGWWAKLLMFKTWVNSPVVFFDLDTCIVGNIDPLLRYAESAVTPFAMLSDFYYPSRLASGVMAWRGDYSRIWTAWESAGKPQVKGGDQAWIEQVMGKADIIQNIQPGVYSYKAHKCSKRYPDDATVVCFHGEPKPHNCGSAWVADLWR